MDIIVTFSGSLVKRNIRTKATGQEAMKALDTNVLVRFPVKDDPARDTRIDLPDLLIAQSAKHSGSERVLTFDQRQNPFGNSRALMGS